MAVPKKHTTSSSRNQRRSHIFLKNPSLCLCPKCKKPKLQHRVCLSCGFYKGKERIDVLKNLEKKERKQKEREIKDVEREDKKTEQKPMSLEELSKKKF